MKKKIDYMKILKWLVGKLNSMTKCGHYHLFETPYICILQEEIGENCLYPAFEDQNSNGLGSIIAGKTPCKFIKYLVECAKEDRLEMGDADIKNAVIDILNLPIEQLQIKADLEQLENNNMKIWESMSADEHIVHSTSFVLMSTKSLGWTLFCVCLNQLHPIVDFDNKEELLIWADLRGIPFDNLTIILH